jgi:hypothetical protein
MDSKFITPNGFDFVTWFDVTLTTLSNSPTLSIFAAVGVYAIVSFICDAAQGQRFK